MASILIVDDDVDVSELAQQLLELRGHEVRLATDGAQGIAELTTDLADVVLLDIEMPVLDGPGMAHEMSVRDRGMEQIPIVVCSGAASSLAIAREIGTPYVLEKPYGFEKLCRVVNKALSEGLAPQPTSNGSRSATVANR